MHTSDLMATSAWRNIAVTLSDILTRFFDTEVNTTSMPDVMPDPAYTSSIVMSDVEHQIELGIGIIADTDSAAKIAEQLFGDASLSKDEEMIADIIGELCNLAMGGLKSSFSPEGFAFSGGIPQPHSLESLQQFLAPYGSQQAAAFRAEQLGLIMLAGVKRKKPVNVPAYRLAEGMVLADDFLTDKGLVLLRSGTRLTANYIERLHHCGADRMVKVCDPET